MIVRHEHPPNYAAIVAAFPQVASRRGIFYAYGDTIFNPDRAELTPALTAHESVHCHRQREMFPNAGPEGWWDAYIADVQFRLGEEIVAHQAVLAPFGAIGATDGF